MEEQRRLRPWNRDVGRKPVAWGNPLLKPNDAPSLSAEDTRFVSLSTCSMSEPRFWTQRI